MSWLGDFAGGAAEAGAGIIGNQIKLDQQQDYAKALAEHNSQLEQAKAEALARLKVEMDDQQRVRKTGIVNDQLAANANNEVGGQFPDVGAAPAVDNDGRPLSEEATGNFNNAKSVLEKAKAEAIAKYTGNYGNVLKASVDAGYDDPAKLVTLMSEDRRVKADEDRNLISQGKLAIDQQNADTRERLADAREKQVMGMIARMSSGAQKDNLLPTIDGMRKDVADESSKITGLMKSEMATALTAKQKQAVKDQYQPQLDALDARRNELAGYYDFALKKVGLPVPDASTKNNNTSTKDVGKSTDTPQRLKFNPATGKIE